MKKILVTGGAGYIGSHTIVDLIEQGFHIISVDNFANSSVNVFDFISKITHQSITNYAIDLCDLSALKKVFTEHSDISGIIHFAAFKSVNESVNNPILYYRNNLDSLLNLLSCCAEFNVPHFVFSSSCSVYGNAVQLPVTECSPLMLTESPYAETKLIAERILLDFAKVSQLNTVILRYFNPIGAHISGLIGESQKGEVQNIIPRITGTALKKYSEFKIFGNNYNTKDGTCVRDYVHVSDIAHGHTLALKWLETQVANSVYEIFNMGSGTGVSVLEMVHSFEKISEKKLNYTIVERRAGDVEAIYANNTKAKEKLGWSPKFNLDDMMRTAWQWENNKKY